MKKMKKYLVMVCLTLTVALCGMSVCAKEKPTCAKKVILQFCDNPAGSQLASMNAGIYLKNIAPDAKGISVKSSSKKINAFWNPGEKRISLYVKGQVTNGEYKMAKLRNGEKTQITLKFKQNGKTYTLKSQVVFRKQANPVKAISIDGKPYKKFKNATATAGWTVSTGKKMPSSVKLKVTPKSGCKIVKLWAGYHKPGRHKEETKEIKNGSKVKTSMWGGTLVSINVEYYQKSDLQGILTGKELKELYGQETAYYAVKFK